MRTQEASSLAARGACSVVILLILPLSSCTKNAQQHAGAIHERDSAAEVQKPRDTLSASLAVVKGIVQQKGISTESVMQESKSSVVDTLVGSVYISGNEPFTRLTLALENGTSSIFVEADTTQSKQLRKLQGRTVKVSGTIVRGGIGDYIRVKEFVIVQ